MLFLTSCVTEKIDGEDVKEEFVRSSYYSVEYGTETHFEMGILLSLGSYFHCMDQEYYVDNYGTYMIEDENVTTILEMNGKQFKVEIDNSKLETIPSYDLDLFENEIWERTFVKGLLSRSFNHKDDDFLIQIYDSNVESFSYTFIYMYKEDKFRFTNLSESEACRDDFNTIPLYTTEELLWELWELEPKYTEMELLDIRYNEYNNQATFLTHQGPVYLNLTEGELFADFEGTNDVRYNINTKRFSIYDFSLNRMVQTTRLPDELELLYYESDMGRLEDILYWYKWIFIANDPE